MDKDRVIGVVIDSGHGGIDPGAVVGNLREKDFNLRASLYMRDRLNQLGIPNSLTMEVDQTLSREERIRRIRNAFGASPDVVVVSNHMNASGGEGAEVVYALRNNDTLARLVLENIGAQGQIMRRVFQRRLPSNPSLDYYFIIRDTNPMETILVEYGFLDNPRDQVRLQENLLDYVEGVVKALAIYTNTPYIPVEDSTYYDFYTVVRGDTLFSIARVHNTTVEELKRINQLTSDTLSIGQRLRIREQEIPIMEEYFNYTVVSGDSLWSISQRFHTTVTELVRINNLTTNLLSIGQNLRIPGVEVTLPNIEEYDLYIVVKNDTLWSIATRYNTTVDEIRRLNSLTTNTLSIGQILRIRG